MQQHFFQFDELLVESERFETMTEWNDYVENVKIIAEEH